MQHRIASVTRFSSSPRPLDASTHSWSRPCNAALRLDRGWTCSACGSAAATRGESGFDSWIPFSQRGARAAVRPFLADLLILSRRADRAEVFSPRRRALVLLECMRRGDLDRCQYLGNRPRRSASPGGGFQAQPEELEVDRRWTACGGQWAEDIGATQPQANPAKPAYYTARLFPHARSVVNSRVS